GDLLVDGPRHADAAGGGEALQPRRNIDAVTEQLPVTIEDITDRDADAKIHLPARPIGAIAGADALVHVHRAAPGIDRARELGQQGVPHRVDDAAAISGGQFIEGRAPNDEAANRLLLVLSDQLAVADDIGGKNRRNPALHR